MGLPGRLVGGLALMALAACGTGPGAGDRLEVRQGEFHNRVLLSGEITASRGADILIPQTPDWRVTVQWLAEDGEWMKAGDVVAEFDPSSLQQPLLENELAEIAAGHELNRIESEGRAEAIRLQLELEQRSVELEKALLQVEIPDEIRAELERERAALEVLRSRLDLATSSDQAAAHRVMVESERGVQGLERDRARTRVEEAAEAIEKLALRAPVAGLLMIEENPREGRRIQAGDVLWVGLRLARIPDLDSLAVEAWLPDVDDGRVEVGDPAQVTLDAFPETVVSGRVAEIGEVAELTGGRRSSRRFFRVLVELEETDSERMIPGHSVKVEVRNGSRPEALLVPRWGIDFEAEPPIVRVEGGDPVAVVVLDCNLDDCVVAEASGLEAGQTLEKPGR